MITMKAENLVAQKMKEVARQEGVPIIENKPLARSLLHLGELDQYIPSDMIEPVAEVIRYVMELKEKEQKEQEDIWYGTDSEEQE